MRKILLTKVLTTSWVTSSSSCHVTHNHHPRLQSSGVAWPLAHLRRRRGVKVKMSCAVESEKERNEKEDGKAARTSMEDDRNIVDRSLRPMYLGRVRAPWIHERSRKAAKVRRVPSRGSSGGASACCVWCWCVFDVFPWCAVRVVCFCACRRRPVGIEVVTLEEEARFHVA